MIPLVNLTDDPIQQMNVTLGDGSIVGFVFTYRGATQRWTCDVVNPTIPPDGAMNGINLCVHPNILRKLRNIISFGLTITSSDNGDPVSVEDFINGRISLFVLDNTAGINEVDQIEKNIFGELL